MSRSVESITQVTKTSAAGATQVADSADGLRERSERLSALLSDFKVRTEAAPSVTGAADPA